MKGSSNLKDKLLENEQEMSDYKTIKEEGNKAGQTDANSTNEPTVKEVYTISETPSAFICKFFEALNQAESTHELTIGRIYILIATILLTGLMWIKSEIIPAIPSLEVIFSCLLIAFVLNYFLLNGGLYRPFLDNEDNSYLIKVTGGYTAVAIILFYYSLQYIPFRTAMSFFYFAFFGVIVIEILLLKESFSKNQLLYSLGTFLGSLILIGGQYNLSWDSIPPNYDNQIYGIIFSLIAAILIAFVQINMSKMYEENFCSMAHVFLMMVILIIPIFFPIQGVVKPTLNEWGVLAFMGFVTTFVVLLYIKGFQLENAGNVSIFVYLHLAFGFIINFVLGSTSGALGIFGALIVIACVVLYSQETRKKFEEDQKLIGSE